MPGFPKTSGADGLHVYIPLQPGTSYETALIFCQLLATLVAHKHPKEATVVRAVRARGRTVYVDYLQNVRGKTLAAAYSARGSEFAGVSTPLTWKRSPRGRRTRGVHDRHRADSGWRRWATCGRACATQQE